MTGDGDSPQDPFKTVAGWLAGGIAVTTAVFTLVGVTSGELNRIFRNDSKNPRILIGFVVWAVVGAVASQAIPAAMHTKGRKGLMLLLATTLLLAAVASRSFDVSGYIGLVLVGLAITVFAFGVLGRPRDIPIADLIVSTRWLVLLFVLLLFMVGILGLLRNVASNRVTKDRPVATGSISFTDEGLLFDGTVMATGVSSDEQLVVVLEGLSETEPLAERRLGLLRDVDPTKRKPSPSHDYLQTIHQAFVGPDADGKAQQTVKTPIVAGLYERVRLTGYVTEIDEPSDLEKRCDLRAKDRSCIVVMVPQSAAVPSLSGSRAAPASGAPSSAATAAAKANPAGPQDVLQLVVWSPDSGEIWYHGTTGPAPSGTAELTATVLVPETSTRVCAAAKLVRSAGIPQTADARPNPARKRIEPNATCRYDDAGVAIVELRAPSGSG